MPDKITIELNQLRFFAYHGFYEEEKKIGAEFEVNLSVSFSQNKIAGLNETVNYEKLYFLIKEEMKRPRSLLETLSMEIARAIHHSFPQIKKIEISISKLQVPIAGFTGHVAVKYSSEH